MSAWRIALLMGLLALVPTPARAAEQHDMRLVGAHDLQARSAYQPVIHPQGDRVIAYVGHHGGLRMNPLTGQMEQNGTSIVDVTDPKQPKYLHHIPGAPGEAEAGGAAMARVCDGKTLPRGAREKTYLLRTLGNLAHEVWDVTDPGKPARLTTVLDGLKSTHKNWWECEGVHGPIAYKNRVYFAYGTGAKGVLQIVDREKLLAGDAQAREKFAPTVENLLYPQIGRLDMSPAWGGHTSLPVLGVRVPHWSPGVPGRTRDFVLLVSESLRNECQEVRQLSFMVDVTTEKTPYSVATFEVPDPTGDFCRRGGRFGPHSSHESFTPVFYGRLVFLAYFNAGVRAVDIRDPFHPVEAAYFIPEVTAKTDKRCVEVAGTPRCKTAIQTNNVEVDDRGYIYLADRADTGLHIVELTGTARTIANFPGKKP